MTVCASKPDAQAKGVLQFSFACASGFDAIMNHSGESHFTD